MGFQDLTFNAKASELTVMLKENLSISLPPYISLKTWRSGVKQLYTRKRDRNVADY
jgi:hypothetical protein